MLSPRHFKSSLCNDFFLPSFSFFFCLGLTAALTGHSSATKTALQMSRLGHQARQMSVEFAIKKGAAAAAAAAAPAAAAAAADRTYPTCL